MSNFVRGHIWPCLVVLSSLLGCAKAPTMAASSPIVAHGVVDGPTVSLESRPSPTAAQLLPEDAHYRVVFVAPREVALLVEDPRGRITGRLRIHSLEHEGATVLIDDFDGPAARIEAWPTVAGLRGQATIGQGHASWQVSVDLDGSLAGRRWSGRQRGPAELLDNLRRARAIGHDLGRITHELQYNGALADARLLELVTLAELSLDLSVRAWEGHDRARLPALAM
jgi:hypothetical protein